MVTVPGSSVERKFARSSMKSKRVLIVLFLLISAYAVFPQTTEFTYQGSLKDMSAMANGRYDFEFALYDSISGGNQIGATIAQNSITLANGLLSVKLDFGNQFPGTGRFLEIRVRPNGGGAFTTLTPRQQLNSAPYSVKSLNADNATNAATATTAQTATNATNATTANNALNLGGVGAGQYILNGDARLSDARNPLPGSSNYVQPNDSRLTDARNPLPGSPNYVQPTDSRLTDARNPLPGSANYVGPTDPRLADARNPLPGSANYVQPTDSRLTDARNPLPASPNYIQNTTSPQAANLNITGTVSIGGNLPPAVAPAGQGRIYFDTASGKVKVSENGTAFVNLVGASGVSGGVANNIPVWTSGTTLSTSIITQSANGVQLPNGVQLGVGAQGNNISFGSPNGETGMTMGGATARADLRFDGTTIRLVVGQAGVGPPPSTNGLSVDIFGAVSIGSVLRFNSIATGGISTLCLNGSAVALCNSSSLRYKTDLHPFAGGLNVINRLRPITFKWKADKRLDVGFGAEDVAAVEPLLTFSNDKGEIEGVKYDRLSVVFVNAIKE